jgi:hypothetical protein
MRLFIWLGGIVAVVMIIIGALTYMFSDIVSNKSRAIARIRGAMWALVLLASSWLILNSINPQLVNLNLKINPAAPVTSTSAGTPSTPGVLYPPVSPNAFDPSFGTPTSNIQLTGDIYGTGDNKDKLQQFTNQCQTAQHGAVKVTGSDGTNSSTYTCFVAQYQP